MKQLAATVLQLASIALALLRGVGEFTSLQRWRLREWIAR